MKKVFTSEQISSWFKLDSALTTNNLVNEELDKKCDTTLKDCSPSEIVEYSKQENGGAVQKAEPIRSDASPSLTNHKFPTLPITKNKKELISLIESNSVVIVRGATGSGKTTQLPQFIFDHHNDKNAPCNIVVTQPRKIGATSIARWVATQRKCTLGSLVGYQIGLEKMATEHTRLLFVTTGVLLQKLVLAKSLTEYSHIFVDEVHERTEEMDFLLLVLKKFLYLNSFHVKIILMSATINCQQFADYFAIPIRGKMSPAYVFEVEGAPYTIEEFYLDDIQKLLPYGLDSTTQEEPFISPKLYDLAISLIQSFDEMEGKESGKAEKQGGKSFSERGSVLIFLPGLYEISHMQDALSKLGHKRLQVYPLHSSVTIEEQNGVFLSPVPGYRKVILSTNIAESSVTVPDVKYVIDFCLARHMVCDQDTNYQSLRLTWASKTNCNQRKGRAGRVSKGFCFRLVTEAFWKNEMREYMIPEIQLAPLSTILLKVKLLDMGDPCSLLSKALSPPNISDIVRTVLQLMEMGAISVNEARSQYDDGELTLLGRVLAHLPVDIYLGKLIVLGHVFGCLHECLIIAASLSLKSFFAIPSMQQIAGHRSKLSFAHGTPSDLLAFVNAFKAWHSLKKTGQLRHPKVAELYEDLRKRVSQFNMHVPNDTPSDYTSVQKQKFILQVAIAGAYYPNYFFQGEMDEQLACKDMNGFNPRTTVMVRNIPPYGFLYYKQLQALFRIFGQVKTITFDSSRAYIEFYMRLKASGVLPEVSLSLLMNSKRFPMELSVYPTEQIEFYAGRRPVTHMKFSRLTVDIQSESFSLRALSNDTDQDKLPSNRYFVINITEVLDVGHFWGFLADEASLARQRQLTAKINKRTLVPVTVSLFPNLLCLAPYSEINESSLYYRAKILHLRDNGVEVFFLDFGNTAVVSSSTLREMPSDLHSQSFQAQEFEIAGLCPSAQSIILGNRWSSQARNRFIALVKNQSLLVSLYSIVYGVLRVELLVNINSKNTSVLDVLVEEGHAVRAEENLLSKQNHEDLNTLYKDKEQGANMATSLIGFWKEHSDEDKELLNSLFTHFSKSPKSCPRTKVHVHGPSSSYEANFHCLSLKTPYKTVFIDKTSINYSTLNVNPHFKHQRMLVAGAVSVNSIGTRILLRDTSILPDIPGLPGLLMMLFAPVMELRTNEERTCYIGALFGLGFNSQTGEAILHENDIEMPFDVKFDVDDITEINALRLNINRLLGNGPGSNLHLGPDRISQLQEECRERLTRLFIRNPPREALSPVYCENHGKWNQVDPALKIYITEPGSANSRAALLKLHSVVLLNS